MFEEISEGNARKHGIESRALRKYAFIQTFLQLARLNKGFRDSAVTARTKRKAIRRIGAEFHQAHYPEETFEVWHEYPNINANLFRHNVAKPHLDPEALADALLKPDDAKRPKRTDTEAYEQSKYNEYHDTCQARKLLEESSLSWSKLETFPHTQGFELMPRQVLERRVTEHINTLRDIVHLKILDRDFDAAFRAYSLLIRLPVDLRSIWPLGIEVLKQQHRVNPSRYPIFREERFFDWLEAFFPIPKIKGVLVLGVPKVIRAPTWRSGTQLLAPLFVITSLWSLVAKGQYSRVRDKLDEYLLAPPYNMCGELYFIRILCHLAELSEIVQDAVRDPGSRTKQTADIKRFDLVRNLIKTCCATCDQLGFTYEAEWLQDSIGRLESIIHGTDHRESELSLSEGSDDENNPRIAIRENTNEEDEEDSDAKTNAGQTGRVRSPSMNNNDEDSYYTADELQPVNDSSQNQPMDFDFDLD